MVIQILKAFTAAGILSWAAFRTRALTRTGLAAAVLLGGMIFSIGGWQWSLPLLFFFLSSSLWSRAAACWQNPSPADSSKQGRDAFQVMANGGTGLILAGAALLFPDQDWVWPAYLGSLAAVNADTWATEVGSFNPQPPRLITTGKRVPPGTSGAISWLGSLAAGLGSSTIAAFYLAYPSPASHVSTFLFLTLAGVLGSMLDSVLGATLQGIYTCPVCQEKTESHPVHSCGSPTSPVKGWRILNNNLINFLSSAASTAAAAALFLVARSQ